MSEFGRKLRTIESGATKKLERFENSELKNIEHLNDDTRDILRDTANLSDPIAKEKINEIRILSSICGDVVQQLPRLMQIYRYYDEYCLSVLDVVKKELDFLKKVKKIHSKNFGFFGNKQKDFLMLEEIKSEISYFSNITNNEMGLFNGITKYGTEFMNYFNSIKISEDDKNLVHYKSDTTIRAFINSLKETEMEIIELFSAELKLYLKEKNNLLYLYSVLDKKISSLFHSINIDGVNFFAGETVEYVAASNEKKKYIVVDKSEDAPPGLILQEAGGKRRFAINANSVKTRVFKNKGVDSKSTMANALELEKTNTDDEAALLMLDKEFFRKIDESISILNDCISEMEVIFAFKEHILSWSNLYVDLNVKYARTLSRFKEKDDLPKKALGFKLRHF